MPEKARVFAAEDDPDYLDTMKIELGIKGHTLALTATTLEEALKAIETFPTAGIQIAALDGNLKRGVKSGSDGRQMVAAIRNISPSVKIIGMSGESMEGVDIDLGKDRIYELGKVVTEL
ncbi:response regulator [Candidatus Daviesbacteria bacterium]|nr:response regulator [Candidatus Daviesbacteria bacterium]